MDRIDTAILASASVRMPINLYATRRTSMPAHIYRYCSEKDVIVTAGNESDIERIELLARLIADDPSDVSRV